MAPVSAFYGQWWHCCMQVQLDAAGLVVVCSIYKTVQRGIKDQQPLIYLDHIALVPSHYCVLICKQLSQY